MQTLTMYKGRGKNALGIEDFTLKTMLGRGGFGKVQSTTGYKLILPCRLFLPRGRAHGKCAQSRLWTRRTSWRRTLQRQACWKEMFSLLAASLASSPLSLQHFKPQRGSSLPWSLSAAATCSITLQRCQGPNFLRPQIGHFPESTAKFYTAEIVLALQFLHEEVYGLPSYWHFSFSCIQGHCAQRSETWQCDANTRGSCQTHWLWRLQKGEVLDCLKSLSSGHASTKHNHDLVWHAQFLGPRVAAVSSIHSGRGLVAFWSLQMCWNMVIGGPSVSCFMSCWLAKVLSKVEVSMRSSGR